MLTKVRMKIRYCRARAGSRGKRLRASHRGKAPQVPAAIPAPPPLSRDSDNDTQRGEHLGKPPAYALIPISSRQYVSRRAAPGNFDRCKCISAKLRLYGELRLKSAPSQRRPFLSNQCLDLIATGNDAPAGAI